MANWRPTAVKILHLNVQVVWAGKDWFRATGEMAQYDPICNTITVYEGVALPEVADSFLHEVLHAYWRTMNPGESLTEEAAIRFLSPLLCTFVRDNPAVVKWWTSLLSS